MLVMLSNSNLGTYFVDNDDMFRRRLWYLILDLLLLTKIGMTILDKSRKEIVVQLWIVSLQRYTVRIIIIVCKSLYHFHSLFILTTEFHCYRRFKATRA